MEGPNPPAPFAVPPDCQWVVVLRSLIGLLGAVAWTTWLDYLARHCVVIGPSPACVSEFCSRLSHAFLAAGTSKPAVMTNP